jgi:hypothetical protein
MKPAQSILDHSFRYVPAVSTSVAHTWRRFGWQPTTDDERKRRRHRAAGPAGGSPLPSRPFYVVQRFPAGRRERADPSGGAGPVGSFAAPER